MTRRKPWFLSIAVMAIVLLGGCWDATEMTRLGIIVAAGFDYDADEQKYEVTISALEPGPTQGGGQPQMKEWKVSVKSTNIFDAVEKIRARSHNELTWKHCQLFVIHAGMEQEAMRTIGDWLLTMPEIRSSSYILFTPMHAKTFMSAVPEQKDVLGIELYGTVFEQVRTAIAAQATLQDLFISAASPSYVCVAARGEIVRDMEDKPVALLYGSAIIHDYQHVGWFDPQETLGYYFARGLPHDGVFPVDIQKDEKLVFESIQNKSKIRPYYRNGQLRVQLTVDVRTRLANISVPEDKVIEPTPATIRTIEKAQAEAIRNIVQKMLDKSKQLKADVLDIAEAIYRFDPDYYRQHIHNWENVYPQIPIDIQVHASLRDKGRNQKPLHELRGGLS